MYEAIKNFAKQFAWEPRIENAGGLKPSNSFTRLIVAGMGGSHLAADLLKMSKPGIDFLIHSDYGLPPLSDTTPGESVVIASSYSGNTEETLDAYDAAKHQGLSRAAVAVGGKLLERAAQDGVPYIRMPDTGIQPRSALGFGFKALLALMGEEVALRDAGKLAEILDPAVYEEEGKELAGRLKGYVPVIYTSLRNAAIGYNWKIKFNETGKIPAFANVFPELNHNEMTGFDVQDSTRPLSQGFFFLFLKDPADHPKVVRRMEATVSLYRDRRLPAAVLELVERDANLFYKIFSSLILADWAAYFTAKGYGVEAEQVPMVEEFKKRIA